MQLRRFEVQTLHYDGKMIRGRDAALWVGTVAHSLIAHTDESRAKYRELVPVLRHIPDDRLSYYVPDVKLPADMPQSLTVTAIQPDDSGSLLPKLLMAHMHIPEEALWSVAAREKASESKRAALPHPTLASFGINISINDDIEAIVKVSKYHTALDVASHLLAHHPELMSLSSTTASQVRSLALATSGINDLANAILDAAENGGWAKSRKYSYVGSEQKEFYDWVPQVKAAMAAPMAALVNTSKNTAALQSTSSNAGLFTIMDGVYSVSAAAPAAPQTDSFWQASPSGKKRINVRPTIATSDPSTTSYLTTSSLTPMYKLQIGDLTIDNSTTPGQFSTTLSNSALHYLIAYAQFFNDSNDLVTPDNWTGNSLDNNGYYYLATVPAVNTTFGVPGSASQTTVSFPWPTSGTLSDGTSTTVSYVNLVLGGIGHCSTISSGQQVAAAWQFDRCIGGTLLTILVNFVTPIICAVNGVLASASTVQNIANALSGVLSSVIEDVEGSSVATSMEQATLGTILLNAFTYLGLMLVETPSVGTVIASIVAKGEAEKSVPIIGWIAMAASILVDAAMLVEAAVDLSDSPSTYQSQVDQIVGASWQLSPDPNSGIWPPEAALWIATATPAGGTARTVDGKVSSQGSSSITANFNITDGNSFPLGATVNFTIVFMASNGSTLCGGATSGPQVLIPAAGSNNIYQVPAMDITQVLVPISSDSTLSLLSTLDWSSVTSTQDWSSTADAPSTTVVDLNSDPSGYNLGAVCGIGVNNLTTEIVYSWTASGQNYDILGENSSAGQATAIQAISYQSKAVIGLVTPANTLPAAALVAINPSAAAAAAGAHFYATTVTGTDESVSAYLYNLVLNGTPGTFSLDGTPWGQFNAMPDAIGLHPNGAYIAGVHTDAGRLEILELPNAVPASPPMAQLFAGSGQLPGRLTNPVAVHGVPGSGFAILEAGGSDVLSRIQVLDFYGNPIPLFDSGSPPVPSQSYFNLASPQDGTSDTITLLDLAVDTQGYFYILKYISSGSTADDYYVDVYDSSGNYLTQQGAIVGGKFAVDNWRTIYVLSYQVIGTPSSYAPSIQPAISLWVPQSPTS